MTDFKIVILEIAKFVFQASWCDSIKDTLNKVAYVLSLLLPDFLVDKI